jgi:uncharacterized protein DUF6702
MIRPSLLVLALTLLSLAARHPDHGTLVEMDHHAKTGAVEIAVELSAYDLERALGLHRGKPTPVDKVDADLETAVFAYLKDQFELRLPPAKNEGRSKPLLLSWVGMELEDGSAWLYVEAQAGPSLDDCEVTNSLLSAVAAGHVNTVNARSGRKRATLLLDAQSTTGTLNL